MAESPAPLGAREIWPCAVLLAIGLSGVFYLAAPAPSTAQTLVLQFNRSGTVADPFRQYFNLWNDVDGTDGSNYSFGLSWVDGVAASGGVRVFHGADTTATFRQFGWNFETNGASVSVCALVHANDLVSDHGVQLGFLNVSNNGLNDNSGVAFESYCLTPQGPGLWAVHERVRSLGVLVDTERGDIMVVPGHWYKFVVSMTNTAGAEGNYTAGCAVSDYGADGITPGADAVTVPATRSHTGQTDITVRTVWPGLRASEDAGIDAWDNFVAFTPKSGPVLTLVPTNTVTTVGSQATFAVVAEGPGVMSYSWYTNSVLVPGANSRVYTTPPLTVAYTNVTVRVANENGAASWGVQLDVALPPAFALVAGSYSNGVFRAAFPGPIQQVYILQASSDLADWIPIATNQAVSSPIILTDPGAASHRSRFYRIIQEP